MKHRIIAAAVLVLVAGHSIGSVAQPSSADASAVSAPISERAGLTAELVDADKKALKKSLTIVVRVHGIKIVDPASVNETPHPGQGHFHYRLDGGPVIATTASKLSFHELTPGPHKITVALAGNDHSPLGLERTLNVLIP